MNIVSTTRNEGLDKFYTLPNIVDKCIISINTLYDFNIFDLIIEPSAGSGNFLFKLPLHNRIGIDISPDNDEIVEFDFLKYKPDTTKKNILTIGNPPFGKVSSLAVKFFIHSTIFSNVIAFIIPRTFRKVSIQNRLNLNFHLILDEDIPLNPCSFTPKMMVKCCFQIWERKDIKRQIIKLPTYHIDWEFLKLGPIL